MLTSKIRGCALGLIITLGMLGCDQEPQATHEDLIRHPTSLDLDKDLPFRMGADVKDILNESVRDRVLQRMKEHPCDTLPGEVLISSRCGQFRIDYVNLDWENKRVVSCRLSYPLDVKTEDDARIALKHFLEAIEKSCPPNPDINGIKIENNAVMQAKRLYRDRDGKTCCFLVLLICRDRRWSIDVDLPL